jgi:hypothetical protein
MALPSSFFNLQVGQRSNEYCCRNARVRRRSSHAPEAAHPCPYLAKTGPRLRRPDHPIIVRRAAGTTPMRASWPGISARICPATRPSCRRTCPAPVGWRSPIICTTRRRRTGPRSAPCRTGCRSSGCFKPCRPVEPVRCSTPKNSTGSEAWRKRCSSL